VAPKPDPLCPSTGVSVDGLLHAIRVGHHSTYDRVVFEFCGSSVPQHNVGYVAGKIHMDPSDLILSLRGGALVGVVFHGGTIDTARYAPDPAHAPLVKSARGAYRPTGMPQTTSARGPPDVRSHCLPPTFLDNSTVSLRSRNARADHDGP
jgi:hypothetical protein